VADPVYVSVRPHSLTMNRFSVPLIRRYYARRRARRRALGSPEGAGVVGRGVSTGGGAPG
jgi:hypothetical protein